MFLGAYGPERNFEEWVGFDQEKKVKVHRTEGNRIVRMRRQEH